MGLLEKLFGKSSAKKSGGLAVIVGSRFCPSQEIVQRFSSDGHLEGCSSVSTVEDPNGWTSDEGYKDKAIFAAFAQARRKGLDPKDYDVITQHGDFPRLGGKFYVVRLIPK